MGLSTSVAEVAASSSSAITFSSILGLLLRPSLALAFLLTRRLQPFEPLVELVEMEELLDVLELSEEVEFILCRIPG